jgi:hypothetical protein
MDADVTRSIKMHAYTKLHDSLQGFEEDSLVCDVVPIALDRSARDEWIKKGIATSCAPNYDTNQARIINDYSCYYNGKMMDDTGYVGIFPQKEIRGRIFSCDLAPLTSDDLMNDVRRSAFFKLGGKAFDIDESKFACSVFTFPL